jgi:hypothetical protein
MWRDAATPTVGMKADAAVKLNAQGIVPKRQTREDLGYTDVQIQRMEEEDEAEVERSPVAALARMADQRVMPPGAGNDGANNVAA